MTISAIKSTTTPAQARLLWHEALGEWSDHEMSGCSFCARGSCRKGDRLAEVEQAAWLAWLSARRLAGESV